MPSALRLTLLILVGLTGCGSSRVRPPSVDAAAATKQAMAEYDANSDGTLDEKELERCPSLKSCLVHLVDTVGGKKKTSITAAELQERIASYYPGEIGTMTFTCQVLLSNRPLSGATVRLLPEKFLGSAIKPAKGTTDAEGYVNLQAEEIDAPGMHCGLYRVEISKKDAGGQETIPARYNAQTILGQEVAPVGRGGEVVYRLSGK